MYIADEARYYLWGLGWWKRENNTDTYQNQNPYGANPNPYAHAHGRSSGGGGGPNHHNHTHSYARNNANSNSHNSGSGSGSSRRRPPPPPTSVALDDRFDAMTTEVPTEWGVRHVGDGHGRDYEESISGYQNYVNEMERMLGGEVDLQVTNTRNSTASVTMRKIQPRRSESSRTMNASTGVMSPGGDGKGRRGLGGVANIENVRQVTGRKGAVELVEHKIMEDNHQRTISLWRERVAQSNASRSAEDEVQSEINGPTHRRINSGDARSPRRMMSEDFRGSGRARGDSVGHRGGIKSKDTQRVGDYERSEYLVSVQKTRKHGGAPKITHPPSEVGYVPPPPSVTGRASNLASPRMQPVTSPRLSPQMRRAPIRADCDRSEYMITFPNTPPYSQGSPTGSSDPEANAGLHHPVSPAQSRTCIPIDGGDFGSMTRASQSSPVELILSSCEPSLLHIAPVLAELGIHKMEHLRAMCRLSEETRDREVKELALRMGVTVMEWAILWDKLQTL